MCCCMLLFRLFWGGWLVKRSSRGRVPFMLTKFAHYPVDVCVCLVFTTSGNPNMQKQWSNDRGRKYRLDGDMT